MYMMKEPHPAQEPMAGAPRGWVHGSSPKSNIFRLSCSVARLARPMQTRWGPQLLRLV